MTLEQYLSNGPTPVAKQNSTNIGDYVNIVPNNGENRRINSINAQYPINNNITGFTDIDAQRLQYELNAPHGDIATAISTGIKGQGNLGPAIVSGSIAVPLSKQNSKVYNADINIPLNNKVQLVGSYQKVDHPYFNKVNNRNGIQYTFDNDGSIKAYTDNNTYKDDYNKNTVKSKGVNVVYPINKNTKLNIDYNNNNGLAAYLANMQYKF